MKLISSGTSPFVRKVRVLVIEANLGDVVEQVPVTTSPLETAGEAMAANPLGRIPALVRPDGPSIYDSRVITRYLNAHAAGNFYPEARIWETLTLEATADGMMDSSVSMLYETRMRPEDKVWDGWLEAQWTKVNRSLDVVNERWMSHLAGPLDMSHIAIGCLLGYLDFRFDARDWRKGRDSLAAWYEQFARRESMKATEPK